MGYKLELDSNPIAPLTLFEYKPFITEHNMGRTCHTVYVYRHVDRGVRFIFKKRVSRTGQHAAYNVVDNFDLDRPPAG